MGEIGDSSGSDYPGALDTNNSLEYNNSVANRTKARAAVPNDLAAAIVAIEGTLGIDPQGNLSTVKARLDGLVTISGIETITGQKAFTGGVNVGVSGIWGTATVAASGFVRASGASLLLDGGIATGSSAIALRTRILDIGDWNMDATFAVEVAHGLTLANIRRISVLIRNDANSAYTHLTSSDYAGVVGGTVTAAATIVEGARVAGAGFDNTNYDSTSYNRGWIIIDYV